MRRLLQSLLLATALLALLTPASLAGGWALVTLDDLPTQVIAGQPLTLGFMIRQHGQTPLTGVQPRVIAHHLTTPATFAVSAYADGAPGHYAALVTFPSAGEWRWVIHDGFTTEDAFGLEGLPMPNLHVLDSAPGAVTAPQPTRASLPLVMGGLSAVVALGGLLALARTRSPWVAGIVLGAGLISALSFASTSSRPATAASNLTPLAQRGRDLFIAKGCVVCHSHAAVNEIRRSFSDFRVAPTLTDTTLEPGYLTKWLFKPDALKPNTEMPTLNLKDAEIEALVAFLTTK